ncbi:MAG TPA: sugar phosphate isomerase/epimerase [Armatimonadota bacterium]|jgi:sugar phosphate isomerase/epimerase
MEQKVGIQLIVYGRRPGEDLAGVLKEVAEAGYAGVEGGVPRGMEPQQVRDLYAQNNLLLSGSHTGFADLADPAKLEAHISFLKLMGSKALMCSGIDNHQAGLSAYKSAGKVFEQVGRTCKAEGIDFCYHNHAWEFEVFDGKKAIHYLAEVTDPELVKLCVDVYWVHVGGENPVEFIERYANRIGYFHFKDGAPGSFTELGKGEVDLKACLAAARKLPVEWITYEQDHTDLEPKEAAAQSRQYLRTLGI